MPPFVAPPETSAPSGNDIVYTSGTPYLACLLRPYFISCCVPVTEGTRVAVRPSTVYSMCAAALTFGAGAGLAMLTVVVFSTVCRPPSPQ